MEKDQINKSGQQRSFKISTFPLVGCFPLTFLLPSSAYDFFLTRFCTTCTHSCTIYPFSYFIHSYSLNFLRYIPPSSFSFFCCFFCINSFFIFHHHLHLNYQFFSLIFNFFMWVLVILVEQLFIFLLYDS